MSSKGVASGAGFPGERPEGDACVWASEAKFDSTLLFGFTCQMAADDNAAYVDLILRTIGGDVVRAEELPSEMWVNPEFPRNDKASLPHFFIANGFYAVSEPFANVLSGFDLGRSKLLPVTFLHLNRKDRFPGQHYLLNLAEKHRHFSPEHSVNFRPVANPQATRIGLRPIGGMRPDDITVAPAALSGPDIWIDDTFQVSLFFSDPLVRALRAAKLTAKLLLVRCRVARLN